jgi:uroporphyrin-III C-methyltransferase
MGENYYSNNNNMPPGGVVYLVGGGPGDPGLITLRGLECLKKANVVVYDRLSNDLLLSYAPQAEFINAGKTPNNHPIPQHEINDLLVKNASKGKTVVRLKGGDPFVFGRGGEEAQALVQAGIRFEIVPGVSSAIAVPAYAGIPVTQRGMASSVAFITGHNANSETLDLNWRGLAQSIDTLVFLMGVKNLPIIVNSLMEAGRSPNTPVAVIEKGTMPQQKIIIGSLGDIQKKAKDINHSSIIIIGDVVNLHNELNWFFPEGLITRS